MKHNKIFSSEVVHKDKIFSSEVVHKDKTLDKVLEGIGSKDSGIEVIEAELVDNDSVIDNNKDSLTQMLKNSYPYSISTKTAAKILRAIYEDKPIKVVYPFYKYRNKTPPYYYATCPPASVISVTVNNFTVYDGTNFSAQFASICIASYGIFSVKSAQTNCILDIQLSNGKFLGRQQEAFELAGLTIEDFYRKFLPDNPYFPAE